MENIVQQGRPVPPAPIGGPVCQEVVGPAMIQGDRQALTQAHRDTLWRLFEHIGIVWGNLAYGSSNLKSSWLEMLEAKAGVAPSYSAEYINATYVVAELVSLYGEEEAFRRLFLANGIAPGPPLTRLAHAKQYVVNEFITAQVMMSGFKHFGGKNYHGYVKGSRYNRLPLVREYKPPKGAT